MEYGKSNGFDSIFSECPLISSLPNISKWNILNVKNLSSMFSGCSSLVSVPDISKWKNIHECKCADISNMFKNCISLSHIPDMTKMNFSFLEDEFGLFNNCFSSINLFDISLLRSNIKESRENSEFEKRLGKIYHSYLLNNN